MKHRTWAGWASMVAITASLLGCMDINGNAEFNDKGAVKSSITFDFSKLYSRVQVENPALSELVGQYNCAKFKNPSPKFKCEDIGPLKFRMTDEIDKPAGVSFNEASQELSVDVVKYYAEMTDLKRMSPGLDMGTLPSIVPLRSEFIERYKREGLNIQLTVQFTQPIVRVDGQDVNSGKREMTVNFFDIVDKNSYVIVSKSTSSNVWTWGFIVIVLLLLTAAILFLLKRQKSQAPTPPSPTAEAGGDATASSKKHTFAKAMAAAGAAVSSAAMGGGAQHSMDDAGLNESEAAAAPQPRFEGKEPPTN